MSALCVSDYFFLLRCQLCQFDSVFGSFGEGTQVHQSDLNILALLSLSGCVTYLEEFEGAICVSHVAARSLIDPPPALGCRLWESIWGSHM